MLVTTKRIPILILYIDLIERILFLVMKIIVSCFILVSDMTFKQKALEFGVSG